MSVQAFKDLLNSQRFKYWYNKSLANKKFSYGSVVHTGREANKGFIEKSNVDFIVSKEQLQNILGKENTAAIFASVQNSGIFDDIVAYSNPNGQEQLIFPDVKFKTLNNTITKYLGNMAEASGLSATSIMSSVENYLVGSNIDKGHVFGFGNTLLMRVKSEVRQVYADDIASGNTDVIAQLDALDDYIDTLVDILESYDIKTSDISGLDMEVFAKYRKTSSRWLIEWQGDVANQEAGNKVATILGKLKTSSGVGTGVRGIFRAGVTSSNLIQAVLEKLVGDFVDQGMTEPEDSKLNLLAQKTSPSMKEMIANAIVNSIDPKSKQTKEQEFTGQIKLDTINLIDIKNSKQVNQSIKKAKAELKATKNKLAQTKSKVVNAQRLRGARGQFYSLASLQTLLDARLVEIVKKNMGSGDRRDILNLRSGRLAESVKTTKLTQSREGTITAFYTYMKYPYATFSEGGAQSVPKSRDPKLLITKSIRELAATKVATRLRAVLV